jgi:phytoene/squalene synthetase
MSDDLVKRLRDKWQHSEEDCYAAADRIEKLEAALRAIEHLDYKNAATNCAAYSAYKIAHKALEGKE